ncbi:hypothetical protein KUV80_03520 [Fictibacillus nanhaiensis]|uniref:hypothetical protein n=1 Tax=Fictibacillus nanhaiensis TaxID=742169 RepID=UPI001C972A85|nr:hypothetical protein [Fictibacillus nanhaiensis]MBY6035702.1 hypothetical protein [Fictibacillus nanhaiensis]
MRYIIERPLQNLGTNTVLSYLVDSQQISSVTQGPLRMNVMKMSMDGLKMIPGHITPFLSVNKLQVDEVRRRLNHKVQNGTTTILASARINYLHEADHELKKTRHLLISSSIDYCIGLSLSPEKITPNLIRYCKKKKIAFIELICQDYSQLTTVIWERIREVNFPYQAVIFPTFPETIDEKKKKTWQKKWNELAFKLQIPTFSKNLEEDEPLPLPFLKLVGIYPKKGGLFSGSDADYCLLSATDFNEKPKAVIVRGTIVYSENQTDNYQGFGKEITIVQPHRFGESLVSRV